MFLKACAKAAVFFLCGGRGPGARAGAGALGCRRAAFM